MAHSSINMSEDELINHLKRSNLLTILVEGTDDAGIYRILQEKYNSTYLEEEIDILPCQGRPIKDTFEALLSSNESQYFDLLIYNLSRWFAAEAEKYLINGYSECGIHIKEIFCKNQHNLVDEIEKRLIANPPHQELVDNIYQEYYLKIRGKNIFQSLIMFLTTQNNKKLKYSYHHLYDMGVRFDNPNVRTLAEKIKDKCQQFYNT